LLVVISIIAILSALIFPVFARAKQSAKQTQCLSNLKQIGTALQLYINDNDDFFPQAVDPSDKFTPELWSAYPKFQARIGNLPLMQEVMAPYVKSKQVWECPADRGVWALDFSDWIELKSMPSLYRGSGRGSSYFFRTEIAFLSMNGTKFEFPAEVNVLFDASGAWHGDGPILDPSNRDDYNRVTRGYRYNTIFGDMHAKNITFGQMQNAWNTQLYTGSDQDRQNLGQ
jgi:type II secretory pathway pseudopilin PulG